MSVILMAILRPKEIRAMDVEALLKKIEEMKAELNVELGAIAAGGRATNVGKIKEIKKTISRILTIIAEKKGSAKSV